MENIAVVANDVSVSIPSASRSQRIATNLGLGFCSWALVVASGLVFMHLS